MKNVIIDTNALISFVTDRNPLQQQKAAGLFEKASSLRLTVVCHQNIITEFVYVLDNVYSVNKTKINEIIADFLNMPGVALINEFNHKTVLKLWPKVISDFGDAIIAALWDKNQNMSIATFDVKFRKSLSKLSIPTYEF